MRFGRTAGRLLGQEQGFILVIAMVIMVILSVLGVAALNSTVIELLIAGNDRQEKQLFYGAESGCRRGGQWLRNLQLNRVEDYADADQKSAYIAALDFSAPMPIRDVDPSEETNLDGNGSYPVTYSYRIVQDDDSAGNPRECRPIAGNNPNLLACFYEVTCTGFSARGGQRVIRVVVNKPTDFN